MQQKTRLRVEVRHDQALSPCHSQPKPPTDSSFRVAVVSCTTNPIFNSLIQSPYCLPNYTQQTEWIQTSEESQFISRRHLREIITFPMRAVFVCYVLFHCAFWDQRAIARMDAAKERGWENRLTACSQIPDVAHVGKGGLEIGPAPQPQDRLVGI